MATPTTTAFDFSMKLFIDTKSRRVLFAEAGKDVVDFLLSLLALPVATAVTLVKPEPVVWLMDGSVGKLYASAEKLGSTCVPTSSSPAASTSSCLLLMPETSFEPSKIFFRCQHHYGICHYGSKNCGSYMTDVKGTKCPNCGSPMTATLHYVSPAWPRRPYPSQNPAQSAPSGGSTAQEAAAAATFTVLDDLTITPNAPVSAISSFITLLGTLGVTDLAAVQERTVELNHNKGLMILNASLRSKTVLTDVFVVEIGSWCSTQVASESCDA
ncbi:hypothetical protein BAE44_0026255 [Dichanthelium oligosanthes]|uniref:DUF674 domain-containing protein n=1 Tax=Dichanthelium oligosanthes TaxID=888268 RepID=A0A1E5UIN5_9POAL|nr:hypothetical protein BAE44_0026255 [Dichanthelium oligosanthes]